MKTYLVRLSDQEPNAHEIVGIFVASNKAELRYLVDQNCDPSVCEFVSIGVGGIMFETGAPKLPLKIDEDSDGDALMRCAVLDEYWLTEVLSDQPKWKPLGPMVYGPPLA